MYTLQQTETFYRWRSSLKDLRAATAVRRRMDRAAAGSLGDVKSVGGGVSEMRIDVGAGYRMYFTIRQGMLIVLLAGGDKASQQRDIARAIDLAKAV